MNFTKHITFCIFLTLLISKRSSSQIYSSFDYKKGNSATVFPMENFDDEESFLLAFRFPSHFNLVFLDDSLRLKRMQKTVPFPAELWNKNARGTYNTQKNLYVFMPNEDINSHIHSDVYKFNKEDGSVEITPIRLSPEQEKTLSKGSVRLVKIFQFKDRFYKIWTNRKTSSLYVFYYEMGESDNSGFHSLDIPIEGLGKKLSGKRDTPTPIIRDYSDVSLINQVSSEKVYMFEGEMVITLEDLETGKTDLLSINTETWDFSSKEYPVDGFQEKSKEQNFNSFVYNEHLFQILYNDEGISIHKTHLQSGDLISTIRWTTREEFIQDFPLRKARTYGINKLIESEIAAPWKWFKKSITLLVQPEDSGERLIIASQIYPNESNTDEPNIFDIAKEASSVGGAMDGATGYSFFGYGGAFNAYIDPYSSYNSIIDVAYYFSDKKSFQYDTFWDSKSFDIIKADKKPSRWEMAIKKIQEVKSQNKLRSVSVFERGDKIYLGYYKKRKYYILAF